MTLSINKIDIQIVNIILNAFMISITVVHRSQVDNKEADYYAEMICIDITFPSKYESGFPY